MPLTDLRARKVLPGDKPVSDGVVPGLRLEPGEKKGRAKWILRFVSPENGKRRDMGLGVYPEVSISEARCRALDARKQLATGIDPISHRKLERDARRAQSSVTTFEIAACQVHDEQRPGWRNSKHADQWINTLRAYVFPAIGHRNVADLTATDFAEALRPIWLPKRETAIRVKQRCHKVMKWCRARGLSGDNPLEDVDHLLPLQDTSSGGHQPAMPWRRMPAFAKLLRSEPYSVTKALLEFVILTAARSGEARAMSWDEITWDERLWTVPAERMKTRKPHRVPLSDRALEILSAQRARHSDRSLVFPSPRGHVLSDMALTKFLRDQRAPSADPKRTATAHGFRSSFRDWASENGYPRDAAERALAHTVTNRVEAAYHRTDLIETRRPMMQAWASFLLSPT